MSQSVALFLPESHIGLDDPASNRRYGRKGGSMKTSVKRKQLAISHVGRQYDLLVLGLLVVMTLSGCSARSIVSSEGERTPLPSPPPAPLQEASRVPPPAIPVEPELRVEEETVAPVIPVTPSPPPVEPLAELSNVYFDFDQYVIRPDARSTLDHVASLLKSELNQKLVVEGHCDERGTSAYNLVLGERRAQAVKRYLEKHGMAASQIQVISYGKDRPFCAERNEACWQSNRRAHFRRP